MKHFHFLAFDIGAESGRGVLARFDGKKLSLEEVLRFPNRMVAIFDHLHWNVVGLFERLKDTMSLCAKQYTRGLDGIGIDTWGVDFVLLDRYGSLLGLPYAYRDKRTDGMMERVFVRMPREKIYQLTGIQMMKLNSLFQLYSMVAEESPLLKVASRLLMMPDFLNYLFTGEQLGEFTIATTTQLYNPTDKMWAKELFQSLEMPLSIMPEIIQPGNVIGALLPSVAEETGIKKTMVIAPACHDTGSAVAAVPGEGDGWAYISSGTWSLMGLEVPSPIINEETLSMNFTNEGGVEGTVRLLKNIVGMWLLQECRRIWRREGEEYSYQELTELARTAKPFTHFLDPESDFFFKPDHMPTAINDFLQRTGQPPVQDKPTTVRSILESLAFRYREVCEMIVQIRKRPVRVLHIVGGGARNDLLNQFTANALGIPVVAGPIEPKREVVSHRSRKADRLFETHSM
jgi:rhamnulokinase